MINNFKTLCISIRILIVQSCQIKRVQVYSVSDRLKINSDLLECKRMNADDQVSRQTFLRATVTRQALVEALTRQGQFLTEPSETFSV